MLPDDDTAAALYEATGEEAARIGLLAYEVSNYARPGSESRHNLTYWRYGDYAGIGPGAHGRLSLARCWPRAATARRKSWAERVERDGHGTVEQTPLQPVEQAREMLLMGLRLTEGIDAARFASRTGGSLIDALDAEILERALTEGYLVWRDDRLIATAEGRLRLDALLAALVV